MPKAPYRHRDWNPGSSLYLPLARDSTNRPKLLTGQTLWGCNFIEDLLIPPPESHDNAIIVVNFDLRTIALRARNRKTVQLLVRKSRLPSKHNIAVCENASTRAPTAVEPNPDHYAPDSSL